MKTSLILILTFFVLICTSEKPKDWPSQFRLHTSFLHYEKISSNLKEIYYDTYVYYNEEIHKYLEIMIHKLVEYRRLFVPSDTSGYDIYFIIKDGSSTKCEKSHTDHFPKLNYPSPGNQQYQYNGTFSSGSTKLHYFVAKTAKDEWRYFEDYYTRLPYQHMWMHLDKINGKPFEITVYTLYSKMQVGKPDDRMFEIPNVCLQ